MRAKKLTGWWWVVCCFVAVLPASAQEADLLAEARQALDAAAEVTPAGRLDPAELLSEYRFELIAGCILKRDFCMPLEAMTDQEIEALPRGRSVMRMVPAAGWAMWRVELADANVWPQVPMVWFDDGSPGVVIRDATWLDDPEDAAARPKQVLFMLAPVGAEPAAAYTFWPRPDRADTAHAIAVLGEMAGRPLSLDQCARCFEEVLSNPPPEAWGDARGDALLLQLLGGRTQPVTASVEEDHENRRQTWSVVPCSEAGDDGLSMTILNGYRKDAAVLLAAQGHPAMPGALALVEDVEISTAALQAMSHEAINRWHAGNPDAVLDTLLAQALEEVHAKTADTRPNAEHYRPMMLPLRAIAGVDPDRAVLAASTLLAHEDPFLGSVGADLLRSQLDFASGCSGYELEQLFYADAEIRMRTRLPNRQDDGPRPDEATRLTMAQHLHMLDHWPAYPRGRDDPRLDATAQAIADITGAEQRCARALQLLLPTRPAVALGYAIDLLEANDMEPVRLRLVGENAYPLVLTGEKLQRCCLAAGDRAGLDRLARHGFDLPIRDNVETPTSVLLVALMGGDAQAIRRVLDSGGGALFDADPALAQAPIAHAIARAHGPGYTLAIERWGAQDNLPAWFCAVCEAGHTEAAGTLLDAMTDRTLQRAMPRDEPRERGRARRERREQAQSFDLLGSVVRSGDAALAERLVERMRGLGALRLPRGLTDYPIQQRDEAMLRFVLNLPVPPREPLWTLVSESEEMSTPHIAWVLSVLVAEGIDINQPFNDGRTALHEAYNYERLRLARCLIEAGVDPNKPLAADGEDTRTLLERIGGGSGQHRFRDPAAMMQFRRFLADYDGQ